MADLTQQLREEVLMVDVDSADLPSGESPPPGAKAADPITWGTIVVALATGGTFGVLVNVLYSWVTRHDRISVSIEIGENKLQLTGMNPDERQQLIDLWRQHVKADDSDG
jgi:hypothetical protein